MTREEQRQITEFVERAVTSSPASPLPPLDVEADAIIRALFVRNPDAAYRMTMLAIGQACVSPGWRGCYGGGRAGTGTTRI
jgi:hypothetical protein